MYPRRKIPIWLWLSGSVLILILLIYLLGKLDFPGWVLRSISGIIPGRSDSAYTAEEVRELRSRYFDMESENAILREMIVRLDDEQQIDEIRGEIGYPLVTGHIIYRDHARLFDTAIINRGSHDGIEEGMPVIEVRMAGETAVHALVGRVVLTRAAISRITLITSPDCSFGVIDQRSREIGIVRGSDTVQWARPLSDGSTDGTFTPDVLVLDYLSPSADISVTDMLITNGYSGITPAGIRVGEVTTITTRTEQGWFDIRVRPYADIEHIDTVAVVLYGGQDIAEMADILEDTASQIGPPEAPE